MAWPQLPRQALAGCCAAQPLAHQYLSGRTPHRWHGCPVVLDRAINGEAFLAFDQQHLAPTLAVGDIVIVDNMASHKVAGVRQAIKARGASLRFLLPYSPNLTPIEQAFAKLKQFVRSAAPRSRDTLWNTSGSAVGCFSARGCSNFIADAGYPHSA